MSPRPLALLGLLVLLSTSLYASSLAIGPPRPVSEVTYGPAGDESEGAIVVANGDRALVVFHRGEGAVRIDADGKPLDVPAIRLWPPNETRMSADVVADGDGWLVGSVDLRSDLQLLRVTREGDVRHARTIDLAGQALQNDTLHLAARAGVLVAAHQAPNGARTTVVSGDGETFTIDGSMPELVATRDGFALVMTDRVERLHADGSRASAVPLPPQFEAMDAAYTGSELVIAGAWQDNVRVARLRDGSDSVELIATLPALRPLVSVGADANEIALLWVEPIDQLGPNNPSSTWRLQAARIRADGSIEGPRELRGDVDFNSRWLRGPDVPDIARVHGRWIAVWSEGPRYLSSSWRNLYAANISGPLRAIDEPALLTWRAHDQWLAGTAAFRDVMLVVWLERLDPSNLQAYAKRIGLDGRVIDAEKIPLGNIRIMSAHATDTGFAILGASGGTAILVLFSVEGPPLITDTLQPAIGMQCALDVCAWSLFNPFQGVSNVLYSRIRGGMLTPVQLLYSQREPISSVAVATDGESVLVSFARASGGGTILTAARIDRASATQFHDFAAAPRPLYATRLGWIGDRYFAVWHDEGVGMRASYLDANGNAIDGPETNWEGWKLEVPNFPNRVLSDGERALLVYNDLLYEVRGRTPLQLARFDAARRQSIECTAEGGCAMASQAALTGGPWFRADRVFTQRLTFLRSRAVRR
jgi:hypothetical protein